MFDMDTHITPGMITVDCTDARALAHFWSEATGAPMVGTTPTLGFQRVDDPTPGKNRVHIDFRSHDREAAVRRLESIGAVAQSVETLPDGSFSWTVMTDPEGNFFCVGDGTEH